MLTLLQLAARNVLRNTRRSAVTFIAVMLAVGIMLSIRGLLTGLQDSLRDMVVQGQSGALQAFKLGYRKQVLGSPLQLDVPADDATLARVRAVPHVRAATWRIRFGGMVSNGDTTVFAMLSAIDPVNDVAVCPGRREDLAAGTLPTSADGAVVDTELAVRLGVSPGRKVVVLAPDREGVLNGTEVTLSGTILSGRLPGMDTKVGVVTLAAAQELLRMPGRATELVVAVDDMERVEDVRAGVLAALGPGWETAAWYDSATFVRDAVAIQDGIAAVVSAIFLLVALLGVANTMLMSVLERTREIGTMLSVGMRRRRVRALFLAEAALLALSGALTGAGVALLLVGHWAAAGLDFRIPMGFDVHLYPRLSLLAVGVTIAVTCAGAVLAALSPAWTASRMRPVEALGHV